MPELISVERAKEIRELRGYSYLFRKSVAYAWTLVARRLPLALTSRYNGVVVEEETYTCKPRYEDPLVSGLRQRVRPGDHVVIVGGGLGVTSVVAARQAGPEGRVTVFEGGAEQVRTVRETVSNNGVADRCDVRHAVVATGKNVYGDPGDADRILPSDLTECDVLELDCEGAELEILNGLAVAPRTILVESHGEAGVPADAVRNRLVEMGYTVHSKTPVNQSTAIVVGT